ncbi:hypothetical protein KY330_00575 [Candidatus Woesearchaeota archaeon]|nr:hypothetical protein [Candidatus Woesearchaeota archaeon]
MVESKEVRNKLLTSLALDILGFASFVFPIIGGFSDIVYAPIQAWWIKHAYDNTGLAILGFFEEVLPFTDIIPSCTIAHFVAYRSKK